ncbi:MAG TPA: 2-C-methyl-D-erythritol 4-phosphate cytidylyltransferase [Tepidisphaeraceae bacterium]
MPTFSIIIATAAPAGQAVEAGGAYVKIDGREALLRSVELFLNRDAVKQIHVVVLPDDIEEAKRKYGPHLSFSGVKLQSGGPRWSDQLAAASAKIDPEATHVVIHDAARPLVPYSDIDALFDSATKGNSDAVALTSPVRSELIQVDDTGHALHHWRSDEFVQLLTPQLYSKELFLLSAARGEPLPLAHATLLKGSPLNQRIRGSSDASLAKAMMGLLPRPKAKPLSNPFEEAQW